MAYRWIGLGNLSRVGGDDIEPGEEFEPTDAEKESFASRMEAVESKDSEAESEDDEPDYEDMEYSELRQLAVEEDTDEINGRSSKDEIIAYFTE